MIIIGIVLATLASFIASAAFYALPPVSTLIAHESNPRPGVPVPAQIGSVVLRSLLTAGLLAGLMVAAKLARPRGRRPARAVPGDSTGRPVVRLGSP